MMDTDDFYLDRLEREEERVDALTLSFEYDVNNIIGDISDSINAIQSIATYYEHEYGIFIDWQGYIKDLL